MSQTGLPELFDVGELVRKSRESPRKRAINIFQEDNYAGPHLGLNVIQPESYVRPHLRYDDEHIIWHSGELCFLTFNHNGKIAGKRMIKRSNPYFFLSKETFHTTVSLIPDSAIWFAIQGPHNPNRFSEFLPSTPDEKGDYASYFEWLKKEARDHYEYTTREIVLP